MFYLYNYFRQHNNNNPIPNYKTFYKKISNELEFGGDYTHLDHLVSSRFMNIFGHVFNVVLRLTPETILDIGCGNGINLPLSSVFPGIKYVGVDYAEKTIAVAKKNHPQVSFEIMDASNLALKSRSIDLVILSNVLILYKNKPDRSKLLEEARRVMKNSGVFILIVWNEAPVFKYSVKLSRIIASMKGIALPEDFMCVASSYSDIKKEVHKVGFEIEERINTASLYGLLESVRYLNMKKYKRKFGKFERESGMIYPQNVLKDLQQMSSSRLLTSIFSKIEKLCPDLFSMYTIYILSKRLS